MVSWTHNCILIGVMYAVIELTFAEKVSAVSCPNGETECGDHATCGDAGTCECSTGYVESLNDGSTCVQVVSAVPCTGTEPCTGIANTECSSDTCKCKDGFKELANTCVKVFGSDCSESNPCTGLEHSVCTESRCACEENYEEKNDVCTPIFGSACSESDPCTGLEHSVCIDGKCACEENYEEKNDGCTLTVNDTPCTDETACESIANAECDETAKMCKCSDGYVMNVDVCDPENGAATLKIGAATLVLFIILTVLQKNG